MQHVSNDRIFKPSPFFCDVRIDKKKCENRWNTRMNIYVIRLRDDVIINEICRKFGFVHIPLNEALESGEYTYFNE